jgi:sterol desaturase/sphingolipid hydroxylase (fatty acid hydroxylase superfamily)
MFLIDWLNLFATKKIQPTTHNEIMVLYKKCLPTVLINTFIMIIPGIIGTCLIINPLNLEFSYLKMTFDFVLGAFMTDILFYTCHRILHLPMFYKRYHMKHHKIVAPIGISALYTTPIDLYVGSLIPIYLPMILLSAHPYTIKIWIILTTANSVIMAHSGFKIMADFHDYHHEKFTKNYGMNLFMDYLMGTKY